MKHPVKYLKVKYINKLDLDKFPTAGPYPNATGMRKYWGENCYMIRSGKYLYKVDGETYLKANNYIC